MHGRVSRMPSRQEKFRMIVEGFNRQDKNSVSMPSEIETLIFLFYFIQMDSTILNDKQIDTLIELLPNSNKMDR